MPLRVLGIDPRLTRCGVGIVDVDERRRGRLVHVAVLRTPPDLAIERRLLTIGEGIAALLDDLRASFSVVDPLSAHVPLYGSQWLMAIASDTLDAAALFAHDIEARLADRGIEGLRYYDARLHPALFALPRALRDTLGARR